MKEHILPAVFWSNRTRFEAAIAGRERCSRDRTRSAAARCYFAVGSRSLGARPATRRRATASRFRAGFFWGLCCLLASCFVSRAQSTNAPTRSDYQSFKIITERNIFDPNRSSRSSKRTDGPKPTRVESFALVGTLSYEKGTFAFFDGTAPSYKSALKTGDTIAGYRIAEISADRVKLEANGQQVELSVGAQMKRQDEGEWQLAGRAESFASSSPATASTDKTDNAASGAENDVLKKLMEKREQDLK